MKSSAVRHHSNKTTPYRNGGTHGPRAGSTTAGSDAGWARSRGRQPTRCRQPPERKGPWPSSSVRDQDGGSKLTLSASSSHHHCPPCHPLRAPHADRRNRAALQAHQGVRKWHEDSQWAQQEMKKIPARFDLGNNHNNSATK